MLLDTFYFLCIDEYRGYQLLLAAEEGDLQRLKKILSSQLLMFQHQETLDSALVRECLWWVEQNM